MLKFHIASLYPMLYRLEQRGLIQGRWVEKAGQRRRRFYRITAAGPDRSGQPADEVGGIHHGAEPRHGDQTCLTGRLSFSLVSISSSRPPAEVVDEIAQHAEALFQRSRAEGASDEQAIAIVEQELADLSEVERTVRTRRAGVRPLPEPTRPGVMGMSPRSCGDLAYGSGC